MIEVSAYGRHDQYYQGYYTLYGIERPYQYTVRGVGTGMSLSYRYPVIRNVYLKLGGGFFKQNFNKLQTIPPDGRAQNTMDYLYPELLAPVQAREYRTDSYTATIGLEYAYPATPGLLLVAGVDFSNYFGRESVVQLEPDRRLPEIPGNQLKRDVSGLTGQSFYLHAGILKMLGPVGVGPYIMLPVIDKWAMTDPNLAGDGPGKRRSKALEGIGLGFRVAVAF
ncbi:hypothetical protein [Chitinophaga barathri]|uniref:Outer membrane protein beta-barrel domain-containing protein n=1 Tax=Chitinophaga barathri TaxID=1647451 RepID=A0A3N4MNZ6_9BACT|nr:hypothetical protein [Chitinophaga barathri]RPD41780.1 hypothetical protein EG028_06325 [Chitinophaga barathri]